MIIKQGKVEIFYQEKYPDKFTINRATPTFSNTYFLQINDNHKDMSSLEYIIKTHFLHVDSNNKLIKRYDLDNEGEGYLAISDFEILLTMKRQNRLVLVDLKEEKEISIPYEFKNNVYEAQLFFFCETGLVLLQQLLAMTKNPSDTLLSKKQIQLTYFHRNNLSKPVLSYMIDNSRYTKKQENYNIRSFKANHHSMMSFAELKKANYLLFDLVEDQKGVYHERMRKIDRHNYDNHFYMWQHQKNHLLMLEKGAGLKQIKIYDINNNKMLDVRSMELKDHSYVDIFFTTTHIATRGSKLAPQLGWRQATQTQIILYNISTQTIEYNQTWDPKFEAEIIFSDYDARKAVLTVWSEAKHKATVRVMSMGVTKDIYMHMLLHVNEDFDDDLLMEAIGLLV